MKLYRRFGYAEKGFPKGATSAVVETAVLYTTKDPQGHFNYRSRDGVYGMSSSIYPGDPSSFRLNGTKPTRFEEIRCDYCGRYKPKHPYILAFRDYMQFKAFFELTPKEEGRLPSQLRDYFSQNSEMYMGNSILDDLDPVDEIKNPWWRASALEQVNTGEMTVSYHGHPNGPDVRIIFGICGVCKRKIDKKHEETH